MMRTITLEIPEETFVVIEEQAQNKGMEPAQLVAGWVSEAAQRVGGTKIDPLVALFGTIESPVPDIADKHDEYIGQALFKELHDESNAD